jgi:hypothetical protein
MLTADQIEEWDMTQHTPGPWRHEWSGFDFEVTQTDGVCVADLINQEDAQETEANARLIATAPDMLEVLHAAEQFLSREFGSEMPEVWLQITDAITKAEGK